MDESWNRSQAIAIALTATGLILFVSSSFQYANFPFFRTLLISRLVMVGVGYLLSTLLYFRVLRHRKIETLYFLFCLGMQAFHGVIEGPNSTDFYSFTGPWFILCSMSLREGLKSWLVKTFPFQMLGLVVPIFFKDPKYYSSVGAFVDSFSLPVSGLIVGVVLAKITSDRYEAVERSLLLEKKLNEALSTNLNREVEVRRLVEEQLNLAKLEIEESAKFKAFSELAAQISHDIRSPLTALNMMVVAIKDLPEEQRLMIRNASNRINDIANQLLQKSKDRALTHNGSQPSQSQKDAHHDRDVEIGLIPAIVDYVVSEKRIQFSDRFDLSITSNLEDSYGAFSQIDSNELKRVLSNLVNNSVEANSSKVVISVRKTSNKVILTVRDNGNGMPDHVLKRLGERGVSFGKDDSISAGAGLGVFHAKKVVMEAGGEFTVNSQLGLGTEVRMTLGLADTPEWFVGGVTVDRNRPVVILDDDISIHNVWSERFKDTGVQLLSFANGDELKEWIGTSMVDPSLYLVDYELLGQQKSGVDVISELGIGGSSYLVTSRFEEAPLKERCLTESLKIIPKPMIGFIPIEVG